MKPDDYHIADSFDIARKRDIGISFGEARLEEAHPNTAVLHLTGTSGKSIEIQASSVGGSRINIDKIDGISTNFSGDNPTLIVHNLDQPGHVSEVTSMLAHKGVNIATMQLYRSARGQKRRGLVYNVEANLTSYTDTGVFCIYFGTDTEDVDHCIRLVHKELKKLRDNKLTGAQLTAAKKQIIGQIGVASDNFENNALDMGKAFLHYGKFEGPGEVFKRIEALTAEQLLEIANEMFAEEYLSTLVYS